MAKSGNPAKRAEQVAEDRRISQVGDFKKRLGGVMELPSGAVVKVRNPGGLKAFLGNGSIPNSLMPIVQKAVNNGKAVSADEMGIIGEDGSIDPEVLSDMMSMIDNVLLQTVKEPKVYPVPEDEEDRDDDLLYVDEFPDEDKQFLFQWVSGGTRDLEQFRREYSSAVDSVATVTGDTRIPIDSAGADAR
jgi:hypothetical protein